MKKSNILQLNNAFIRSERKKIQNKLEERQQKNRFMGTILILVIFLFMLPAYNLVGIYTNLQQQEKKLVELEKNYEALTKEHKKEAEMVAKLKDEEYAAKYVRAKYQYSKEGEFVYNIPGLLK
ncbi:FtsB family cell division protein [Streptococcus ruminantium]|uniref:Septum formation initiator family protein n=1 Tax=Streptococcus ruminantium TaxID=1917441 RepID=A0ABU1B577_9STRE|nr:septum formation initiator family protein [Streptococcus ruminantium]MDQ8760218.1 septum formation initiator family protein [Streptococcus ruminantium]MDQ8765161.1 septum formation initiator family protein [Streptococcus ruminantium]MDQ8766873.1 septum formation initiator family protein [Streptococcus ruminantium]MDQ8769910.1 septum formation initiator family protein [Streptococcus ruminantium]MDQ8775463.1 septum formation initiator family protein [Streptococcus ruminantium]